MSRKRVPLNQNECTADFRIGVPFEQNLQCKQHNIPESTFFCALGRLRKKVYAIPDRGHKSMDIFSSSIPKQDVVRIDVEPEILPSGRPEPMQVLPAHRFTFRNGPVGSTGGSTDGKQTPCARYPLPFLRAKNRSYQGSGMGRGWMAPVI